MIGRLDMYNLQVYDKENFFSFFLFGRIAPALLRQASYGTIKIGIYQSLKRLFVERLEGQCRLLILFWDNTQRDC